MELHQQARVDVSLVHPLSVSTNVPGPPRSVAATIKFLLGARSGQMCCLQG